MTMIAKVEGLPVTGYGLRVFIGNELVGVASPITNDQSAITNGEALYFLTIQSDASGTLRFETEDGLELVPVTGNPSPVTYVANSHLGTLSAPVVLMPAEEDDNRTYKIIEDDHVLIIRNGERYDVTGKKLE